MDTKKKEKFVRLKFIVELGEARPNPLFSEYHRRLIRFLRFYESGKHVRRPCAECGKKRMLWTMLCSFQVLSMGDLPVPIKSGKVHAPLTGVCRDHLLAPEMEDAN